MRPLAIDFSRLRDSLARAVPYRLDEQPDFPEAAPRAAAVLVALVGGEAPGVLLTKRAATLRAHAGQVSFPGGRIDPGDRDAVAAALREAEEEIGLAPAAVEIIGPMPPYRTGTGFMVTPVVGLLPPGLPLRPAPAEVEAVFQLPLKVLLDPAAPRREVVRLRGRDRAFWVWPHDTHYIWGATAAILMAFARALRGEV